MLIARQKKQENIAEYVVYMFQIEDLMRACNLDFEIVKQKIISQYSQTKELLDEISYWYENIIELMKNQKIEKKGHLQEIENVIDDLNDLHLQLLRSPLHPDYKIAYQEAAPVIGQSIVLTKKQGASEIEVCFEMMYMIILLKLQKKEISKDTEFAVGKISRLLAVLSEKYKKYDADDIDF